MNGELLRQVEAIHQDKEIDKEIIFKGIESALISAARKRLGADSDIVISIDRETGNISATCNGKKIDTSELGRIAAMTAKQVIMQKIKEAERDTLFTDFEKKQNQLISGSVQRSEGQNIFVNLGKAEGVLPPREQIPGESYRPGDRLKFLVTDVKKVGQKVRITLSRTHPNLLRALFENEVPEIADGVIEIVGIAREPGHRAKVSVKSNDPNVDCVGACVGIAGSRIKGIVNELGGEKIDIVEYDERPEVYISNALKPATGASIALDEENHCAYISLPDDQLSLAIGKHGQNVRLASKLVGWEIEVETPVAEESETRSGEEIAEPASASEQPTDSPQETKEKSDKETEEQEKREE